MKTRRQITFICVLAVLAIVPTACSRQTQTEITPPAGAYPQTLENHPEIPETNQYVAAVSNNANYFIRTYGDEFEGLNSNDAKKLLRMDVSPFTDFEMVGWSNRGLFAYRYRYLIDDGMISCWVYSLVVTNAVTDEIIKTDTAAIVELKEDSETREYVDSLSGFFSFKLFFKEEREEVSIEYRNRWNVILEEHNISDRVSDPFSETFRPDLLQFPINDFNSWLEHNTSTITRQQATGVTEWDIVSWKLIIGNDKVQKIITEKEDEEHRFIDNISGRKILGYYKSPYQNRIAVVVSHYRYAPVSSGNHRIELDVFGCNMNAGLN